MDAQWAAKRAVRSCDAFLAVGTSGSVSPVSGLLRYANDVGALTVLVNPAPGVGRGFDEHLRMTADAALPLLLAPGAPTATDAAPCSYRELNKTKSSELIQYGSITNDDDPGSHPDEWRVQPHR